MSTMTRAELSQTLRLVAPPTWTDDRLIVWHRNAAVAVHRRDSVGVAVLERLGSGPVAAAELEAIALGPEPDVAGLARLHWLLERLAPVLVHGTGVAGRPLLSVVPLSAQARFEPGPAAPAQPVRLSRLALLRRRDDVVVVESGAAPYRVELHAPQAVAMVAALATTAYSIDDLAEACGLSHSVVAAAAGYLAAAGLTDADDAATDQWGFHEILFHARSRLGRHDEPFGANYRFAGVRPPEPARRDRREGRRVALDRPRLEDIVRRDPPLVVVQEGRRSVRTPGPRPLTLAQLSEFLYRVGRLRATYGPSERERLPYEGTDRPYPTGGASGDLEIYVTAHRCDGLDRASYHYDSVEHELVEVCADEELFGRLLAGAVQSSAGSPAPDVLLTITSRFGRLNWKYDGMAYAATLKHVGVLYQTCYLVATAMGLAPCGLGSGDSQLSARAFGLDWARESSVGEFMLSSRPAAGGVRAAVEGFEAGNDHGWAVRSARRLAEDPL